MSIVEKRRNFFSFTVLGIFGNINGGRERNEDEGAGSRPKNVLRLYSRLLITCAGTGGGEVASKHSAMLKMPQGGGGGGGVTRPQHTSKKSDLLFEGVLFHQI